jgi:hypothetical protein
MREEISFFFSTSFVCRFLLKFIQVLLYFLYLLKLIHSGQMKAIIISWIIMNISLFYDYGKNMKAWHFIHWLSFKTKEMASKSAKLNKKYILLQNEDMRPTVLES